MELNQTQIETIDKIARQYSRKLGGNGVYDKDDFYGQAWVIALRHLDGYQEGRGAFGTYMRKIIFTKLLNFKRQTVYNGRGCRNCRKGGSEKFCGYCKRRQSLKCPFSGYDLPAGLTSREDPVEAAIFNEELSIMTSLIS